MAVAHDAVSESHTGTTGVASVASFTWNHVPTGTPRSALVCTVALGANPVTGVTYDSVAMTAMPYTAYDSDTEPFYLQVWFLDNVGSGTKAVVVNRTNNTVVTYAVCVTQTASKACEVYNAGVKTIAASGTQQSAASASGTGVASSWATLTGVTDGSPGTNSMRYMFVGSGASSVPTAGTNASSLGASGYIDFGNYVFQSFYETAASQGAKDLSVGVAISDDLAVIGLAVRETPVDNRNASIVNTGGGILTSVRIKGAQRAVVDTGGGVYTHSYARSAKAATASVTATGGGILTSVRIKGAQRAVVDTGGGVVVVAGRRNFNTSVTATGGGVVVATQRKGGQSAVTSTGGGIYTHTKRKGGQSAVTATGGGIYTHTERKAVGASVTGTGGGVVVIDYVAALAAIAREASLTFTGGGVVVIDGVAGAGAPQNADASLTFTGGGVVTIDYAVPEPPYVRVLHQQMVTDSTLPPPGSGARARMRQRQHDREVQAEMAALVADAEQENLLLLM